MGEIKHALDAAMAENINLARAVAGLVGADGEEGLDGVVGDAASVPIISNAIKQNKGKNERIISNQPNQRTTKK